MIKHRFTGVRREGDVQSTIFQDNKMKFLLLEEPRLAFLVVVQNFFKLCQKLRLIMLIKR